MRSRLNSFVAVIFAAVLGAMLSGKAAAQQITYYDFDGVISSYTCAPSNPGGSLFCFNNTNGTSSFPLLVQDTYPATIDPNPADPPVQSSHNTLQISAGNSQYASAWFGVPQKVSNGFTVYMAFKLTAITNPPGDGIAFVIQNASGGGMDVNDANDGTCVAVGAGLNISATIGGCLGYGAIDNSVAVEFDTFQNDFDAQVGAGSNHIAIQSCGPGLPNSPNHTRCVVAAPISAGVPTLADGNIHQAVIQYSGPNETPANQWTVYIDPNFVPGTHTPDGSSLPLITQTANISSYINLQNSGTANDSAYVGFTGASGGAVENQQIFAWTFTPHTPVTQEQPISSQGNPTTFNYGQHTFATTYTAPPDDGTTAGTTMVSVANTIDQLGFSQVVAGTPFANSICQVYEGTGGNCIIYSIYCVITDSNPQTKVPCPSTNNPTIAVKTAYESAGPDPISPGFLQGDPLYSQISSISANGGGAITVHCTGECAVSDGQTVSIRNTGDANLDAENVVASVPPQNPVVVDQFTYQSSYMGTASATKGYVTSQNVQNICNAPDGTPPCWQAQKIDGTQSGKTKNFSDLVALYQALTPTGTAIATSANPAPYGQTVDVTVTVTPTGVSGDVTLKVDDVSVGTVTLSGGTADFYLSSLTGGSHTLRADFAQQGIYDASFATGSIVVSQGTPAIQISGGPFPYDGNPHAATVTVTGASSEALTPFTVTYDGSTTTPPTGAGLHTVSVSFTGNSNYVSATASGSISISQGTATIYISGGPFPYDGNPHAAITSVTGVNNEALTPFTVTYDGSTTTPPTNAGLHTVSVSFGGNSNYGTATGSGSISIAQATPVVQVTGGTYIYDGLPHPATGSVTGINNTPLGTPTFTYNGGAAAPVNPGNYIVVGSYAGSTNYAAASATTSITIGASISVSTTGINFGDVILGTSKNVPITVKNVSSASLTITKISFTYGKTGSGSNYGYTTQCGGALKPGKTCTITVTLKAQDLGAGSALLNILYNQPGTPVVVTLTGNVINPKAKLSVSSLSFGNVNVGQSASKTVTLTSSGDTPLLISSIGVTGSSDFTTSNNCPGSLAKNTACNITVTFSPSAKQSRTGTLKITDNASSSPQTVSLTGKGN